MAYVAPSTFVAGEVLTAAQQNVLANNDRFFHGPPTVRVRATTNSTHASDVWTSVPFNTEDWDTDDMFSSTSNRKLICRTAGKYLVNATVRFEPSTAGTIRFLGIQKNTTTAGSGHEFEAGIGADLLGTSPGLAASQLVSLSTGQFIRMELFHDAGVGLEASTGDGHEPTISMIWMSS